MNAETLSLRRASRADARLLFDWLNAPDSLAQKERTTAPVAWASHCTWLESRLADADFALFIVEHESKAIGQVRLEPRREGHLIDIYIVPERRGRGVAVAALEAALRAAGIATAVARVKGGNAASHRLFRKAGFAEMGREGGMTIYRRKLGASPRG
jgi:RimJ/RimL family protein N-acetyltransferase